MTYITLEIERNSDLLLVKKFLTQLKFVKGIVKQTDNKLINLTDNEISGESILFSEHTLSKEWDNPEEDKIWNNYLKSKLNEKI